jgi:sirohydrochlorin ferrochelatase
MIAVQLIAHGSRREEANADLVEVADRLRERTDYGFVIASYLEIADPSIPVAARLCIATGATEILMMPYFLSPGSHGTSDMQRYRAELQDEFPDIKFRLAPPLGLHPLMLEIICDRLEEAR